MKNPWWKTAVIYQIYPKSFMDSNGDGIGDLCGVINKLDYIEELGIDAIWLSPFYQSPMADNGYDISDYYSIADIFGTMEDMEKLIEEAKKRKIKIIMDLVVNHTSDEHPWFIESRSSKTSLKHDWYIWKDENELDIANDDLISIFGGSAWEYDSNLKQYYLHVFSKKQPDLNWENSNVRNEIYKMIEWWLDKGISGFRVDAITFIKKRLNHHNHQKGVPMSVREVSLNRQGIGVFLKELNDVAFNARNIVTIAEAPGVPEEQLPEFIGDNGYFNMLFLFNHVDIDLKKSGKWYDLKDWSLLELKAAFSKSQSIYNEVGWGALYIENHDHPRSLDKFIRNKSDRGLTAAKMLATIYFFMKGTPFIYQGQEIGMTNVEYPSIDYYDDLASHFQYKEALDSGFSKEEALRAIWKRSRDNSRSPMQWDDSPHAGFTKGENTWLPVNQNFIKVNVKNSIAEPNSLYNFYKKLIFLRKNSEYSEVVINGNFEMILAEHPAVFAYTRSTGNQKILIIANFSDTEQKACIGGSIKQLLISNYTNPSNNLQDLTLRPYEVFLCEIE